MLSSNLVSQVVDTLVPEGRSLYIGGQHVIRHRGVFFVSLFFGTLSKSFNQIVFSIVLVTPSDTHSPPLQCMVPSCHKRHN